MVMRKAQGITRIVLVKPVLEAAVLSPAGGGVQETDDLWIQEFMNRDKSEDLEDWERDILGEYIAMIPAVTIVMISIFYIELLL